MSSHKSHIANPLKIAFFCVIALAGIAATCFQIIGQQRILEYATESKPYALLFSKLSSGDLFENENSAKIICPGDSNYFHPPDTGFAAHPETFDIHIPGLILAEMKELEMEPEPEFLDWSYVGAHMFDYYCLYYRAVKLSPDLIIVPINWRSFGSSWIQSNAYFHAELSAFVPLQSDLPPTHRDPVRSKGITILEQLVYKADIISIYRAGLRNWASEVRRSTLSQQAEKSVLPEIPELLFLKNRKNGEKASEKQTPRRSRMKSTFPIPLPDSNLTFQRMSALAHVASQHDTKILFYIWPLDAELLAEVGALDVAAFEASKKKIRETIDADAWDNIFYVDLSGLLEHEYFDDILGHCTIKGRRKIAGALAPKIIEILEKGDISVNHNRSRKNNEE